MVSVFAIFELATIVAILYCVFLLVKKIKDEGKK